MSVVIDSGIGLLEGLLLLMALETSRVACSSATVATFPRFDEQHMTGCASSWSW